MPTIKGLGRLVPHKNNFKVFPYMRLCKTRDPWVGLFLTQIYNLNNHGRGITDEASYMPNKESLSLLVSQKKIFFPLMSLCKTRDPFGVAVFFDPGYNLTLSKCSLDKVTYQISKVCAF